MRLWRLAAWHAVILQLSLLLKVSREGAEVVIVGRWFQSLVMREKKEWNSTTSDACTLWIFLAPLGSEGGQSIVESMSIQSVLDPKKHSKPVVEPALFETVPLEILEHTGNCTRLLICVIVAGVSCCLPLHLFEGLEILLPVRVPNTRGVLQHRADHGCVSG